MAENEKALTALRLYEAYHVMPTDRGGKDGPKGRAFAAFIEAKDAALSRPDGEAIAGTGGVREEPAPSGSGAEQPFRKSELCDGGCQHSKDVDMWPEHSCSDRCVYKVQEDIIASASLANDAPPIAAAGDDDCESCAGTGHTGIDGDEVFDCPDCGGTGNPIAAAAQGGRPFAVKALYHFADTTARHWKSLCRGGPGCEADREKAEQTALDAICALTPPAPAAPATTGVETAYKRGATWAVEMGGRYTAGELHKAAYDYADKATAPEAGQVVAGEGN